MTDSTEPRPEEPVEGASRPRTSDPTGTSMGVGNSTTASGSTLSPDEADDTIAGAGPAPTDR